MIKHCNKCNNNKDISMFYKDKSQKFGIRSICKKCDDITTELWRDNNKEKYLSRQRERSREENARETRKIRSQKHRTEMSSMYIRSLITKKSKDLDSKDIPDELVQLHRAALKIKRKLLENSEQVRFYPYDTTVLENPFGGST